MLIFRMGADPEPVGSVTDHVRKRTVIVILSCAPNPAHLFEMQGGMAVVFTP